MHAVCNDENDQGARRVPDDVTNRAIDAHVDASKRVADLGNDGRVMHRMVRVVEMPALMSGAMGLGEHLDEKIPVGLAQHTTGQRTLETRTFHERADEALPLGRRSSLAVAAPARRMQSEFTLDRRSKR